MVAYLFRIRASVQAEAIAEADGLRGAGADALAAADALRVVGGLGDVHVHLAGARAFAAGDALARVDLNAEQGDLVHQRVKRAERADPLAERAEKQHAQNDDRDQNDQLARKQRAQRRADALVCGCERDRALQHTLRADVLAEIRISHAHVVDDERRQQYHGQQQDDVFQIGQRPELFRRQLFARDFMQQLLQPAERAQKAADEPPEQHAEQDQNAGDIIRKAEFGRADHRLKRPDRARARCRRAGIAVQAGHADGLALALIDAALEEVWQVDVGQQRRRRLDPAAKPAQEQGNRLFFLIQCRHTPSTAGSPC